MLPWYVHIILLGLWIVVIAFGVWAVRRGIEASRLPRENRKRDSDQTPEQQEGGSMGGVFSSFADFLRRIGRHIEFTHRHRVKQDQKFIDREMKREEMKLRDSMKTEGLRVKVTKSVKGFKATIRSTEKGSPLCWIGQGASVVEAIENGLQEKANHDLVSGCFSP